MAFRFSKRIKILPGVSINLGKTGTSVTVGGKGAKVTVGKKGVRTTVGLPGTGLSYTETTRARRASPADKSRGCSTSQPAEFPLWVKIAFAAFIFVMLAALTK